MPATVLWLSLAAAVGVAPSTALPRPSLVRGPIAMSGDGPVARRSIFAFSLAPGKRAPLGGIREAKEYKGENKRPDGRG